MQLQPGKQYKTRDGKGIVLITKKESDPRDLFPYEGKWVKHPRDWHVTVGWTNNGLWGTEGFSDFDLVEEVI